MGRVLGVVRLSRDSDESTSVVRQREYIESWATQNGHTVIGWAEDTDVSGGIAPWLRPELGKWIPQGAAGGLSATQARYFHDQSRAGEFDVICVWRLDRLSRRVLHLSGLIEWCRTHGKTIASTSEGFDLGSPMGRVFVQILAALAEGELEAIKERARSSTAHLMKEGRWRGGFVPYGYRAVKAEKGWRLEIDLETSEVAREIVRRVLAGQSVNSICVWLNQSKVLPALEAQRVRAGKPAKGAEWRVGTILRILHSHTLLGFAEVGELQTAEDGKRRRVARLVRGKDGLPLQRAEPIITQQEWDRVQEALTARESGKKVKRHGSSPILRVAFCACGDPMYRAVGRSKLYYRCGTKNRAGAVCEYGQRSIPAEELEALIESTFLGLVGELEIMERVHVKGSDNTADLDAVNRSLADLREDRAAGLFSGVDGTAEYRAMYRKLEDRREALKALPQVPDRWELRATGETYGSRWKSLEKPEDRAWELREAGFRAIVYPKGQAPKTRSLLGDGPPLSDPDSRVVIELPTDLQDRVIRQSLGSAE